LSTARANYQEESPIVSTQLERERRSDGVIGIPPADTDPSETQEWLDSVDAVLDHAGRVRARELMRSVLHRARQRHVVPSGYGDTDNVNTIPATAEPAFPGDEDIERRIRSYVRWNAAMMVHRAQRPGLGVGGHISTNAQLSRRQRPAGPRRHEGCVGQGLRAVTEVAMGGGSISSA